MTFGERLKEARKQKRLTQQHLADCVSTKKTTISNYETGYSTPSHNMIVDLADVLGVTTDYLLGRIDTPTGYKSEYYELSELSILFEELKKMDSSDIQLIRLLVQRMQKN